jgi:predicted DNA-binding protein (MmcQ/YjbR family)
MVSAAAFRKLALSLPETVEGPHFDSAAFLIKGKIFATLHEAPGRATVKLLPDQQEILTSAEPSIFQRVPNFWGDKGWTWLHLKAADAKAVRSALQTAYANVSAKRKAAPKRLTAGPARKRR